VKTRKQFVIGVQKCGYIIASHSSSISVIISMAPSLWCSSRARGTIMIGHPV